MSEPQTEEQRVSLDPTDAGCSRQPTDREVRRCEPSMREGDAGLGNRQLVFPAVLDACCGPRMMWFDRKDRRALFIDKRQETHSMAGRADGASRADAVIEPDIVADFTAMPFPDDSFRLVVFDPPHIRASRAGKNGRFRKIYGVLPNDWQGLLRAGFAECFRVLKPYGLLVFKWSEHCYPLSTVLELTPHKPLFGHKTVRATHWCVWMKDAS